MITDHPSPTLVKKPVETGDKAYTNKLIAAIEEAREAVKQGEFISFEEFEKEMTS